MQINIKRCMCRGVELYRNPKNGNESSTLILAEGKNDIRIGLGDVVLDKVPENQFVSVAGDVAVSLAFPGIRLQFSGVPAIQILS